MSHLVTLSVHLVGKYAESVVLISIYSLREVSEAEVLRTFHVSDAVLVGRHQHVPQDINFVFCRLLVPVWLLKVLFVSWG